MAIPINLPSSIVRGISIPSHNKKISFAYPPHGLSIYLINGKKISEASQEFSKGEQIASFISAAYGNKEISELPEAIRFKEIMKNEWIQLNQRLVWSDKGLYVFVDDPANKYQPLSINNLEEKLKGGREFEWGGVRVSRDCQLRFAPKGSYSLKGQSPLSFAKDGIIKACFGYNVAGDLGEVASSLKDNPYIAGFEIQEGQAPQHRVAVISERCEGLWFSGHALDDDSSRYYALGILN